MSAGLHLMASCLAQLSMNPVLDPLVLFDFVPERAAMPWAQVEDPVLLAADGAGVDGRIGTLAIGFRDGGERPTRLRLLMALVEDEVAAMPADLGDGWRLVGLGLARTRMQRLREGWSGRLEWAVRVFRVN